MPFIEDCPLCFSKMAYYSHVHNRLSWVCTLCGTMLRVEYSITVTPPMVKKELKDMWDVRMREVLGAGKDPHQCPD